MRRNFVFVHLQFYFRNFFFTHGDFDFDRLFFIKLIRWNRTIFSKFNQTDLIKQKGVKFCYMHYHIYLIQLIHAWEGPRYTSLLCINLHSLLKEPAQLIWGWELFLCSHPNFEKLELSQSWNHVYILYFNNVFHLVVPAHVQNQQFLR